MKCVHSEKFSAFAKFLKFISDGKQLDFGKRRRVKKISILSPVRRVDVAEVEGTRKSLNRQEKA